jgi:hypothetical protein
MEAGEWSKVEAVVAERTEAASQILSTQLTLDKIDSDIQRTAKPSGTNPISNKISGFLMADCLTETQHTVHT